MNNLLMQEELFGLMTQTSGDPQSVAEAAAWQAAYESFCMTAASLMQGECSSNVLRTLEQARIEIASLLRHLELASKRDTMVATFCHKALETLRCERQVLLLEIEHPEFAERQVESRVSPLFLNNGYHPSDLVEIIIPLFEMQFFRQSNKNPALLKNIIQVFEWAFNTSLQNYVVLRYGVLNRKKQISPLLDRMRDVLTELSQR